MGPRNKTRLRRGLSPEAQQALSALHTNPKKPLGDMVEWTALDAFRMRKAEDIPGEGLIIITKEFQLKELR